jgi:hypothetical protein
VYSVGLPPGAELPEFSSGELIGFAIIMTTLTSAFEITGNWEADVIAGIDKKSHFFIITTHFGCIVYSWKQVFQLWGLRRRGAEKLVNINWKE